MDIVLKALLTPALVLLVSFVQRRWGHLLGGRLAALPLTTGPFLLILAATQGPGQACSAARGVLLGMPAALVFYPVYLRCATRFRWPVSLGAATLACAAAAAVLTLFAPGPLLALLLAMLVFLGVLLFVRTRRVPSVVPSMPAWELPARAVLSTAVVLGLGLAASLLGAQVAGVLAAFPALASVLLVFTHRADGVRGPVELVHGLLGGIPWTLAFLVCLLLLLPVLPVWLAAVFACATVLFGGGAGVLRSRRILTP
ncbi:hypothetical protein [Sciscionella sediminilitoris]|uniref:hypothetical protein n=1 Tax=Sciscionella sediminilitoris TaxID=1445613 RepID=UPI0004DEF6CB|nr:hypothetical protein [Sciscionella sp. SE31]